MAKDREDRKKEKREKKEKKEKKERKRREAEELAVREKKISKKHKSKSKEAEKPEKKPKKKSKKLQVEEKPPHKKSKKKHNKPDDSEEDEPETVTVPSDDSHPIKVPIATNESESDFEFDKEDLKHLLESYTKEELVNLIYKTAEKGSRLIAAVLESADRDSSKRNIFVRGLGWDTTHENLKTAFEVYGEIEECSVVMDKDTGRAKGYGFVMFKTRKGAREALRNPEKRMYNRTVSCNLAAAKPAGAGKPREPVESVKIDLANQSEVVLPGPGLDLAHGHGHVHGGLDKGHKQQNVPMYGGQNMPFYGHAQHPGYNPMYAAAFMGNQMGPGVPNFPMYGPGMMNHMGMAGQYAGEGNGVGPGFDGERAWYLR